jgi:hypothetical protein
LTVNPATGGDLVLNWGASCLSTDVDYVVYEGPLGSFSSYSWVTCSTGGTTTWTLSPSTGSQFYLVVPTNGVSEGSHGRDGSGAERPVGSATCFPLNYGGCP